MKNRALQHTLKSQRWLHLATDQVIEYRCVFFQVFLQIIA